EKRNQLKREFGRTLDELQKLRADHDRLASVHEYCLQRLSGLESMLADPQRSHNAVVYYYLDALWKHCRKLLEERRAELVSKFEQLERQKHLENFKAGAVELQKQLERKFDQYDSIYQEMAANLKSSQEQLRRSDKLWHYFRRKKLVVEIGEAEAQVAPVVSQRDECLAELERVRDREPPAFKGLSVAARREINLHLIAFAQYLYIHFSENDLAALARTTQEKHPGESRYGTSQECLSLERPILESIAKLKLDEKRADRLKRRVDHLRQTIKFSGNTDTVPDAGTLGRITLSPGSSSKTMESIRGDLLVNVLEQGYWNLDELLLGEK
ncbi:MAG: hypothetical protein KY410_02305, partial [Proteobacteria bacterium]|nr:hypothetical protein [Pseudomonadota bacterium]